MASKSSVEQDARGQYGKSQGDRKNDGLASATPRDVSGKEDATMENADRKPSPNPGFYTRAPRKDG